MATKITSSTLTLTIIENLELNGVEQGGTNTIEFSGINESDRRIVSIPHDSETTLYNLSSAIAAGTFAFSTTKYIRVTNKDDSNFITLRLTNSDSDEVIFKLDAGQTHIINGDLTNGMTAVIDAESGAAGSTLGQLSSLKAQADTATVDLEIFAAGT